MNPDDRFAMLSRLGVRLFRAHDSGYSIGNWFLFEPKRGVYNTDKLDFDSVLYKKYNIELVAVPLNSDFVKRQYGFEHYRFRDWLIPMCEEKKFGRNIASSANLRNAPRAKSAYSRFSTNRSSAWISTGIWNI